VSRTVPADSPTTPVEARTVPAEAGATRADPHFWDGRSVLLTGHTGFKGAWLALWLQALGARVTGLAPPPPTEPSLHALARVGEHMAGELAVDVRDAPAVREAVRATRPEIVLHLAAQPMVRRSLREPALTFAINVLGTVNVLDAVRLDGESVRAVVVVTSDKCYANPPGTVRRFTESDPLGGSDPYSSSKACAELVTAAYRESFFASGGRPRVASARAGNVIGGGDFGEDRLVPDILRAYDTNLPVRVRNPDAIRPWQHVLSPLSGYLLLAQALCESGEDADIPKQHSVEVDRTSGSGAFAGHEEEAEEAEEAEEEEEEEVARAFNFGPPPQNARTVRAVVVRLAELLASERSGGSPGAGGLPGGDPASGAGASASGGALSYELDEAPNPPEAARLELDSTAAERVLGWRPRWDLEEALARVAAWHEAYRRGEDMRALSLAQLEGFRRGSANVGDLQGSSPDSR
jgi:CDP-glucose 4,6-dehydratase